MTRDQLASSPAPVSLVMIPVSDGPKRGAYRWAIYCTSAEGGPAVLWGPYCDPEMSDKAKKAAAAAEWPGMVYQPMTNNRDFPAFHFALEFGPQSWGRDGAVQAFAKTLARHIGRSLQITALTGWNASPITADPAD
ncbi:hypothetical protein [Roseomonas sp. WA12]